MSGGSVGCVWEGAAHVDLGILEALLEVVVDGLVGDLADQGEVRHANLLLLGRLEDGALDGAF
jgi:hypothetical protein